MKDLSRDGEGEFAPDDVQLPADLLDDPQLRRLTLPERQKVFTGGEVGWPAWMWVVGVVSVAVWVWSALWVLAQLAG